MIQNSEVLYPVMEHFYTIQGEGNFSGYAAYFVRLGGCDVGCVWCDVKESWDASVHPKYSIEVISNWVKLSKAPICVITGGEPAMYDLNPLINQIKLLGVRVHIETSGAYPILGHPDWICLSPKKFKFPIQESLERAHEFKAIIFNKSDFNWAMSYKNNLHPECIKFVQPEWSKSSEMLPLIVEFVKENPDWRISLQTHKYLNIP